MMLGSYRLVRTFNVRSYSTGKESIGFIGLGNMGLRLEIKANNCTFEFLKFFRLVWPET